MRLNGRRRVWDYRGKVAVVTGASAGIGRRLASDLASAGAVVIGVARREERLQDLVTEMRTSSPASSYRICDLADVAAFVGLIEQVEQEFGRIDILANIAGVGGIIPNRVGTIAARQERGQPKQTAGPRAGAGGRDGPARFGRHEGQTGRLAGDGAAGQIEPVAEISQQHCFPNHLLRQHWRFSECFRPFRRVGDDRRTLQLADQPRRGQVRRPSHFTAQKRHRGRTGRQGR